MRDTLSFLMYDWLDVESLTRRPRHADHSRETFEAVLDTSERIAREKFAPANRRADVQEPAFDGELVSVPESTRAAIDAFGASGLLAAGHDYELGGMQLPYVVDMAANTFFSMASIGLAAFGMLTYANANLLMAHGSARQRRIFGQPLLEGRWLGTMCLSEPQAGSSLGDIETRAVADGPGAESDPLGPRYRLEGHKMWISGGEHELGENIVHLVLAKIPGEGGKPIPGPKGISLFIVPRVMVDTEGGLTGRRNDIALAGLNHKLGYRGIPNTLLNFGEGRFPVSADGAAEPTRPGAIGYRVGAPGTGLASMFHMMNEARINVGMGATMLGYAGYLASLEYARNRTQGRRAGAGKAADGPQVRIVEHADVRRMLLAQKAYAEGGLALALLCARLVDEKRTGSVAEADVAASLLELLTPVAKSWPSEWCLEANSLAIQVLGGYGYTRDFPVEQHWRDNRLNMIHEGTHGIQANDLLGRKIPANDGRGMSMLLSRVGQTAARCEPHPVLATHARDLSRAFTALAAAASAAWADGDRVRALANSTPFLQAFGHCVLAWIWLDVAVTALAALLAGAPRGDAFYRGKLQATHYFFRHELPKVQSWIAVVEACDTTCLDMRDDWF